MLDPAAQAGSSARSISIDLFQAGNMGLVRAVANISKMPPRMTVREFAMVNISDRSSSC